MLNRRLIRVKVFQAFYAYIQSERESVNNAIKYLENSLNGVYNTFFTYVSFPIEVAHYVEVERNPTENNFIVSDDQLKQYKAFIIKELREKMEESGELKKVFERPPVNWADHREMVQLGYKRFKNAKFFANFIESDTSDIKNQINFLRECYRFMAEGFEEFDALMEEIEMHWEDEKYPVLKSAEMLVDTLSETIEVPSLAKDFDEDMSFAKDLLSLSIRNNDEFSATIAKFTKGWEAERIAKTDMMLMVMALVEYTQFPYIPVKVTLNEYLEIAKKYSTPQSSKFLNGVLDQLMKHLKEEGKIVKKGRGLVQ